MDDPEASEPGARFMLIGFAGEERELDSVGLTTEGELEEEAD